METRGVASVRSPVCNLRQHHYSVNHEDFVDAVVDAFRQEYEVHEEVTIYLVFQCVWLRTRRARCTRCVQTTCRMWTTFSVG